jgi:hypothetical protein
MQVAWPFKWIARSNPHRGHRSAFKVGDICDIDRPPIPAQCHGRTLLQRNSLKNETIGAATVWAWGGFPAVFELSA